MATCFYCKSPINAMALICPNCRSEFLPAYTSRMRGGRSSGGNNSGWRSPTPVPQEDFTGFWLLVALGGLGYGAYELAKWLYTIPLVASVVNWLGLV